MMPHNTVSSLDEVVQFVEYVRECAARGRDGIRVNMRNKNRQFMLDFRYGLDDVIDIARRIRVEEYSHTSVEGSSLAFVFGIEDRDYDIEIYMKLLPDKDGQRNTVVLSFHEAERPMNFPYRKKKG